MKLKTNFLQEVKEQYEDYPYPPRDPQEEKVRIGAPFTDMPERLNHYCFGGRQSFSKDFRILVAGGGTGDSSIYMAEQYALNGAEIIHLDLSKASIEIAKERAKLRGLEGKITFLYASLLDLPKMNLGKFDYINCSGVLHHLANPEEGLAALEAVLAPDGVMAIMLYAYYGRLGIYHMQDTLRILLKRVEDKKDRIKISRDLISNLPRTNWYFFSENNFRLDISTDSGFFDLLLHPQDRAYTIPELYGFLESAGMHFLSLQDHLTSGKFLYDPARLVMNENALAEIGKLSEVEKQTLAELLSGTIAKHSFYTARNPIDEPDVNDQEFIPVWNSSHQYNGFILPLLKLLQSANSDQVMYMYGSLKEPMFVSVLPSTAALFLAIDGNRSIAKIISEVSSIMKLSHEEVSMHFYKLYTELRLHDFIFLRHPAVKPYKNHEQIQQNMLQRTAKK